MSRIPNGGGRSWGGVSKSQPHKFRTPPDGFRDGDEGYRSFVKLPSTAAEDYDRKRAAFETETRDARRERIVRAKEVQAYREVALKVGTRKSFSDWLAGGLNGASEVGSELPAATESDSGRTRNIPNDSTQPAPTSSVADVEDDFDVQTELSRELQRKDGTNRRGGTDRAERSWARKALQSALVESKAKKVEWFH